MNSDLSEQTCCCLIHSEAKNRCYTRCSAYRLHIFLPFLSFPRAKTVEVFVTFKLLFSWFIVTFLTLFHVSKLFCGFILLMKGFVPFLNRKHNVYRSQSVSVFLILNNPRFLMVYGLLFYVFIG